METYFVVWGVGPAPAVEAFAGPLALKGINLLRKPRFTGVFTGVSTGVSTGVPRKPRNSRYFFSGFVKYFMDFWSNIRVFGQNNVIFELLRQK